MTEITTNIPARLKNAAVNGHVAGVEDIVDDVSGKTQAEINADIDSTLTTHQNEINALNSQNYESVTATEQTTAATDVLPATGEADTIYRVGSWDGAQYDATCYSEYAWKGDAYIHLSTKPQIGEVFDISAYRATGDTLAKYADLAAALDGGNNVPQSLRKGGISIKFVQSSDNKYVQYRLTADEWSIDTKDWSFCGNDVYVENPEFIRVVLDNKGKIIEAIKVDGTKLLPTGAEINEKINFEGNETTIIKNPEFVEVKLDSEGHILWGIQKDSNFYFGAGVPQQVISYIENKIKELSLDEYEDIVAFLADLEKGDETLKALLDKKVDGEYVENSEYIEIKTDTENKILAGRTPDGVAFENVGFSTPKVSIDGNTMENIEDPEGRSEITTDAKSKIISYRDSSGVKHELVGIETSKLTLSESGIDEFMSDLDKAGYNIHIKKYNLPTFGYCDIVSEIFYLTATPEWSTKDDVEVRQDYPDSDYNANMLVTIAYYYVKGTNTKLDFYAASKVTKLNDKYYVTSSLTEIVDPITGDVSYEVNSESIEVRQVIDKPDVRTWPVDKKTEHYCVVSFDFGHFLSGNYYVGVKFQGSSTLHYRKRNFRFTFYKTSSYTKKNKIKVGEMVRLSGFNLKSNWTDITRIKETILYRFVEAVWNERPQYDRYNWDKEFTPYTGATGIIKGFPISVSIGGAFYGLQVFGLKKDGKNYMLQDMDGETPATGLLVCGNGGPYTDERGFYASWQPLPESWDEELNDEEYCTVNGHTQEDSDALFNFLTFVNSNDFTKENVPRRMDVIGWIDYFILMQVFIMYDNTARNLILYSDENRTKFYPFFYDLDLAWARDGRVSVDSDILAPGVSFSSDMTMWNKLWDVYRDEIITRYEVLRSTVLNAEYLKVICDNIVSSIPEEEIKKERNRWGIDVDLNQIYLNIDFLNSRLNWLDKNYFIK